MPGEIAKLAQLDASKEAGGPHHAGFAERHPGFGHAIAGFHWERTVGSTVRDLAVDAKHRVGTAVDVPPVED